MVDDKLQKKFEKITKEIESVNGQIDRILPQVFVRNASTFGNSSHVVLSKELIDKRVGIIVLEEDKTK
jgi:putative transposon-encoded protein